MQHLHPYLRYINLKSQFFNNFYTKCYDCRMIYLLEGTGVLKTEQGDYELLPNSLVYYPCGISYLPRFTSSAFKFITVNFDFTDEYSHNKKTLTPVASHLFNPELNQPTYQSIAQPIFATPFVVDYIPYVKEDLLRLVTLHRKYMNQNPNVENICSSILATILHSILHKLEKSSHMNPLVEKVQQHVDTHYAEKLSLDSIANALVYHPNYINTVFKQQTGKTIHKYLMEYRINRSRELLTTTSMTIPEIALACGFENQSHFITCFKKLNNLTPLHYRKKFNLI